MMGAMVGGWYNRGIVVTGDFSGDARFFFFFRLPIFVWCSGSLSQPSWFRPLIYLAMLKNNRLYSKLGEDSGYTQLSVTLCW